MKDRSTPARSLIRLLAGVYFVALSYLVLAPHPLWVAGDTGRQTEETIDATLTGFTQHLLAYALLACLLLVSLAPLTRRRVGAVLLVSATHALLLEGLQHFVPARCADWPDAVANLSGVALGTLLTIGCLYMVDCGHGSRGAIGGWRLGGTGETPVAHGRGEDG